MSNPSEPRVSTLQIHNLFGLANTATYDVPIYQRDYAWTHEEIEALLQDLLDFHSGDSPYYLLGQIIVAPSEGSHHWELVDGQQRLTSLFLIFLAAYKLLQARGAQASEDPEITGKYATLRLTIEWKPQNGPYYLRVSPARGGEEIIRKIIIGETMPAVAINGTAQNIKANYEEIYEKLSNEFPEIEQLIAFVDKIFSGVWIMRLEMASNQLALEVFEKINNRGRALNSADLLKNLLFSQVETDVYDDLSNKWETAVEKVFAVKPRRAASMEFLMQAWIFGENGVSVPSAKVYKAWRDLLHDKPEAVNRFGQLLPQKSNALNLIGNGRTPKGDITYALEGTRFFGAVQHFIILLAGSHLESESFNVLANVVENRTVLSLLAKELSQDFQRILPKWAQNVQQLEPNATHAEIMTASESALTAVPSLLEDLKLRLPRLTYAQETQKKRIRYVLARVSSAIEAAAGHDHTENTLRNCLKTSTKSVRGYDLDHILPQSVPNSTFWIEGEDASWVDEIGNLVLLHPGDNRSAGDVWPTEKVADYNSSQLLLTRSLCNLEALGEVNGRVQTIIDQLHNLASPELNNWNSSTADARANLYYELLRSEFAKVLL